MKRELVQNSDGMAVHRYLHVSESTPNLLARWTLAFERFDDASLGHSKANCKVLNMLNFPPGLNISAIRIMCHLPSEPLC